MECRKIIRGCLYAVSAVVFCVNGSAYAGAQDAFDELDQTDADTGNWVKPKEVTAPQPERTIIIREVIRVERVVEKEPERRVAPVAAPSPRPSITRTERPVKRVVPTETGSGILFEFKKCSKRGNDLECHFNMTSQYFDRQISFSANRGRIVTFYDDVGNSYKYSKVKIASKETENPYYDWNNQLISDISTNAVFYFKNISSQAKSISKFEINSAANKSGHWEKFVLTFRDLDFHLE